MNSRTSKPTKSESPARNEPRAMVAPVAQGVLEPEGQLREIRDLLFGEQLRGVHGALLAMQTEFRQQLDQLNQRLDKNLKDLKTDFRNQITELSEHTDQQLTALAKNQQQQLNELAAQTTQQHNANETRDAVIEDDLDSLRATLDSFQNQTDKSHSDLQQELGREVARLTALLQQRHEEALAKLRQTADELSNNKADRKALANLLSSMATNLEGEAG